MSADQEDQDLCLYFQTYSSITEGDIDCKNAHLVQNNWYHLCYYFLKYALMICMNVFTEIRRYKRRH